MLVSTARVDAAAAAAAPDQVSNCKGREARHNHCTFRRWDLYRAGGQAGMTVRHQNGTRQHTLEGSIGQNNERVH